MNCPTSQLQHNFNRIGFWQGQIPSASVAPSVPLPPSASVARSASLLSSAPVPSSVASSATAGPSVPPSASVSCSVSALPSDSVLSSALLPAFYQPNMNASPQLNVPSLIGQANSSVSAPFSSMVHRSSVVFSAPSTVNALSTSHSSAVRFPFPAGVAPIMNPFEMIGTDSQMFPQTVRLNPNLALCSTASFGGYANANTLSSVGTAPSIAGNGLHHFAIPRISQQSQTQPTQGGLQFSLGQSTFFGADASTRNGRQQQQQTQSLFDLSNGFMCTNASPMTNANVISMAAAISKGSFLSQQKAQQTTKQSSDGASQRKTYAFCDSSVPSPLKQSADSTEPVKIPKETVAIPLERSCASSSSAGSAAGEHRPQQSQQMNCQVRGVVVDRCISNSAFHSSSSLSFLVCYLAASNGLHFGARTCAACAAFFRRSISDQKRYICKKSQRCVTRAMETQGYRKMCRNCRMRRCLEVGMLPENVQNKRSKRDFYFADAVNNAISQQQQRVTQQQTQPKSTESGETQGERTTEQAKGGDANGRQGEQRRQTESHGTTRHWAEQSELIAGTIFGNSGLDESQSGNGSEYGQQQMPRQRTAVQNNDLTTPNSTTPWGITLREI